ncbi:hypothetical protein EJB05_00316, partial [Eragrostis curvula]
MEEAPDVPLLEAAAAASPRAVVRRSKPWSRSSSIGRSSGGGGSIEYTSLRDVLDEEGSDGGCGGRDPAPHSWRAGGSWGEYDDHLDSSSIHDLDASAAIGIRNTLLKHAASAYLQSAVVVAAAAGGDGRDGEGGGGCCCGLARLWRSVVRGGGGRRGRGGGGRGRVLMRACSWQLGCVDDPAEACAAFVARSASRVAEFVAGRVRRGGD